MLVGTYGLLDICDQSGQLVRRHTTVHLPRYNLNSADDASNFASVLLSFQKQMPLVQQPDLVRDVEYFFLKTAGCIGILKDWLMRSMEQAMLAGRDSFDAAFADRFALPNNSLLTIINEAMDGERRLKDVELDDLKAILYGNWEQRAPVAASETPKKGKRRGRVGTRKPARDKVGGLDATT